MKVELNEEEIKHILLLCQRDTDVVTGTNQGWRKSMALHAKLVRALPNKTLET
jgi:hypothetical protein